jgi:hypothetical protein
VVARPGAILLEDLDARRQSQEKEYIKAPWSKLLKKTRDQSKTRELNQAKKLSY